MSENFLVKGGRAAATVVRGEQADELTRFAASELVRYVEALTGARLPVSATVNGGCALLVGTQQNNPGVAECVTHDLPGDSDFLLRTVRWQERPALALTGRTSQAALYAVYEFIERCGVTFLNTGDLLPQRVADLPLPQLDVVRRTPYAVRSLGWEGSYNPPQTLCGLADYCRALDQMAKLKFNRVFYYLSPHEPWTHYQYRGEWKLMGDLSPYESGYLTWKFGCGSFLTKDIEIGQEHFRGPRVAPPELQDVQTPREAFERCREMLRGMIAHARQRGIEFWLAFDPCVLPPNFGRFCRQPATSRVPGFYTQTLKPSYAHFGFLATPTDPVLHEINEVRLRHLLETYDPDGVYVWLPECFWKGGHPDDAALYARERPHYAEAQRQMRTRWKKHGELSDEHAWERTEADIGFVHIIEKTIAACERLRPGFPVGVGSYGKSYLNPVLHRKLPPTVALLAHEAQSVWTPAGAPWDLMAGMADRPRIAETRLDDDGDRGGVQFNLTLLARDKVLQSNRDHGVTGLSGWSYRFRGADHHWRFLSEGAYEPDLTPDQFYRRYAVRVFGEAAVEQLLPAFRAFEENDAALRWRGQLAMPWYGAPPFELLQPLQAWRSLSDPFRNSGFATMDVKPFAAHQVGISKETVNSRARRIEMWDERIHTLQQALPHFENARQHVRPTSRETVLYLISKTKMRLGHYTTLRTINQAHLAYAAAFEKIETDYPAFVSQLLAARAVYEQALEHARATTRQAAEIVDHPTDQGVLYCFNAQLVVPLEVLLQFMGNVVAYHHGRDYWNAIEWHRVPGLANE